MKLALGRPIPAVLVFACLAVGGMACNVSMPSTPPPPPPIVVIATPTPLPPQTIQEIDVAEQRIINVYERVSPSVVHITSRSEVFDFWRGAVPREGSGSGFVLNKDGNIVTNYHVIEDAQEIEVLLADGSAYSADLIGADPYNDLAVVHIDAPSDLLVAVEIGSAAGLRVGQRVIAIGNPFGLDWTLTTGVVSALGRTIETENGQALGEVIQTDAAINPGNSGGPLLDSTGRLVGVNTAIRSPSGGSVGIGFAIPAETVQRVVPELITRGYYPHPWIGISTYELSYELKPSESGPEHGLLVVEITPGGPADQAGLQAAESQREGRRVVFSGGDIVIAADDKVIKTRDQLTIFLENNKRIGDTVVLSIIRDDETLSIPLEIRERPR